MATNKDFLNRQYFLNNSNIKLPVIDNIFNLAFVQNKKLIDVINTTLQKLTNETNAFDILSNNAFIFTLSNMEIDFSTQFLGETRNYVIYKRQDSNFQISFVESSNFNIRIIIDEWMKLSLPENAYSYYYDDISTDIKFKSIDTNLNTRRSLIYNKCIPVSYQDTTYDLGKDTDLKLVSVNFVYKNNRMS